jgi:cytochrome c oxidase subunit 2
LTIKILGNQWYWSYDYSRFKNIQFDSFIKPTRDINIGEFRLLETDNSVIIPFNTNVLCLLRSNDVIHSWAIPRLNLKYDANPGRLNSFFLYRKYPGIYYGQCSEICGANHSFIPIKLEVCNSLIFKNWVISF